MLTEDPLLRTGCSADNVCDSVAAAAMVGHNFALLFSSPRSSADSFLFSEAARLTVDDCDDVDDDDSDLPSSDTAGLTGPAALPPSPKMGDDVLIMDVGLGDAWKEKYSGMQLESMLLLYRYSVVLIY